MPFTNRHRHVFSPSHLGFLHLHDVGLTVGNAVIDVVDVGRQRVHLLVEGKHRLLGLRPLPRQPVPLPDDLLFALGQLLSLLRQKPAQETKKGLLMDSSSWI